jgi:hypothetical protein
MYAARRFILNQKGFSLLEAFMAMGFMAVSMLSVVTLSLQLGKHQQGEQQKSVVYDFKEELIVSLNNNRYWQNLVNKAGLVKHPRLQTPLNPELACVRDGTICNEGEYDLTLFTPDSKIRFDALDQTAGFNSRGELCNTFQREGHPDPKCSFRFKVKWSPVCELGTTSCLNPLIKVKGELQQTPGVDFQMMTADLNFSFMLVADPIADPIVKNLFLYTNSDVLNFGTSALDIDLSQAVVYGGAITALSFSSPPTASNGGSVTISGSALHYQPANKYYGRDTINLSVTAPSRNVLTGTITIGVMTPHTWLGPVAGNSIGLTKDSSNFCGMVVNGFCDRTNFPAWPDLHMIFNDLCISCDAYLDSNAATFEMASSYSSTVWLAEDAPNIGWVRGSVWPKNPVFEQKNGRFLPLDSNSAMTVSNFIGFGWQYFPNSKAFALRGGEFTVPRGSWWLRIIGGVDITGGTFNHNQGKVEMFSVGGDRFPDPTDLNVFNAPNVQFWDLSFGALSANLGANVGFDIASSFTVKNKLGLYPQAFIFDTTREFDTLCAWENNARPTGIYSDSVMISVEGTIDVKKYGGKGSRNGCKAPQIRFVGAGEHLLTGSAFKSFDPDPTATETWIKRFVPHMPFLKIDDPAVSVKIVGSVGFRRGLDNASNSRIDFSGAAIVLGNTDPGTAIFRPETLPAAIQNPLKDLYLASASGGFTEIRSRQMRVEGGLYSLTSNATCIQGDAALSELHLYGDLVLGPGENPKNQSLNTKPVRVVIDGPNAQTIYGGLQAATFGRTGYDGQMQMDLHVTKPVGASAVTFRGLLTLLRDYVFNSGPAQYAAGFALYIPDTGSDSYVHNLGMGGYLNNTNDYMGTVSINHNLRIVSDLFFTNFGWNNLNYSSTKTVEAAAPSLRLRVLENFRISTMNQSGAFDTPIRSVGANTFELFPIYGYGGPQGAFRPLFEILTPNSEVVSLPQIDLGFTGWNQTGYVRALDFKGHLSVRKIWLDGETWVCMYPSSNGTSSSLTAPRTNLTGWIKPSAIMTNGQTLSPGSTTLSGGSIIANSNPTYPCP